MFFPARCKRKLLQKKKMMIDAARHSVTKLPRERVIAAISASAKVQTTTLDFWKTQGDLWSNEIKEAEGGGKQTFTLN